jgi:DNA-binding GntR family transcriptional regulator
MVGSFDRAPSLTLSDYLVQEITRKILGGDLQPGDRLQEAAIAQQVGVSRGPVREALRALQENGLVTYSPNRGVWVTKLSPEEVQHLLDVRLALEGLAARLAAPRMHGEASGVLSRLVERMRDAATTGSPKDLIPLDVEFHRSVAELSGNRYLARHVALVSAQARLHFVASQLLSSDGLSISTSHAELLDALQSHDPDLAERAMHKHIRVFGTYPFDGHSGGATWPHEPLPP